jgi:hypothetical protein
MCQPASYVISVPIAGFRILLPGSHINKMVSPPIS